MKKLIILFLLFFITAGIFGQQWNPQNEFYVLGKGQLIGRYIGKIPLPAITTSKSGNKYQIEIRRGDGLIIDSSDYANNSIKNIIKFNCGNETSIGTKSRVLILPKDSLVVVCSYREVKQIPSITVDSLFKKWDKYFENLADDIFLVGEEISDLQKTVHIIDARTVDIEKLIREGQEGAKEIPSPSFPWLTVAKAFVIVAGVVIGYLVIRNNTRSNTTIINNIPNPDQPGGKGPQVQNKIVEFSLDRFLGVLGSLL